MWEQESPLLPAGPQPDHLSLGLQVQRPNGLEWLMGFVFFLHALNSAKIPGHFRTVQPSLVTPVPPTPISHIHKTYF